MARLVRARVKRMEELPDWGKCCPKAAVDMSKEEEEFQVDLDDEHHPVNPCCYHCKKPYSTRVAYKIADRYMWAEVELLDLDEAGAERVGPVTQERK